MTNHERKKYEEQRRRIMKKKQEISKKLAEEKKIKVIFQNLEEPVDVEFTYEGVKTFYLKHGEPISLPASVLKHLMSLKVPVYRYETDPKTGQVKPVTTVTEWRNRFAFVPVDAEEITGTEKTE